MAINKKIAQLEAKAKALSLDTVEKKGLTRLQGQAKKISNDEANQAELAADKDLMSKTEQLQKDIARLRLKLKSWTCAMPCRRPSRPHQNPPRNQSLNCGYRATPASAQPPRTQPMHAEGECIVVTIREGRGRIDRAGQITAIAEKWPGCLRKGLSSCARKGA